MNRKIFTKLFQTDYVQTAIMIVIILLSVIAFWFGFRMIFQTEHPLLAVASGSMQPTLQVGDLIVVQGVTNSCAIRADTKDASPPGDVIVFRKPSDPQALIVHRAIESNDNGETCSFRTQGDANVGPDYWWVTSNHIVGKYTGIKIPLLGYVALFFEPFEVKVAFILLWLILLVILEFIPFSKNKRNREQRDTRDEQPAS